VLGNGVSLGTETRYCIFDTARLSAQDRGPDVGRFLVGGLAGFLLWGLVFLLPGVILGIVISVASDGSISGATVAGVMFVTGLVTGLLLVGVVVLFCAIGPICIRWALAAPEHPPHLGWLVLWVKKNSVDLQYSLRLFNLRDDERAPDPPEETSWWKNRDTGSTVADRPVQQPDTLEEEAFLETIKHEFPRLEFTDAEEAYYVWGNHLKAGRAFLSELRYLGVDAELTRCWWPERYSMACEITVSGQLIASIVLADWDGIERTEFLIPDPRIQTSTRQVKLRTVHLRSLPVFGRIRDVVWKAADLGTGLKASLNGSQGFREPLLHQNELTLGVDDERSCWVLTMRGGWNPPTGKLWRCYLSIADLLLRAPLPAS